MRMSVRLLLSVLIVRANSELKVISMLLTYIISKK